MSNGYVSRVASGSAHLWQNARPLLGWLDMELTERCNNDCIHCWINLPADDVRVRKRELTTNKIKEILKESSSLGCLTVRFTGGEPLLREDFGELYVYARRLGMKVMLFTNATLLTPSLTDLFARVPPLVPIEITVFGMKRQSYEAVTRTPGSFAAAWRGIHLLLERRIPFVVNGALLPPNKDDVEEFEAWATTIPWIDHSPCYSMIFDLRCRRDQEKNKLIKKLRPSCEERLRILTTRREEYLKEMREFCCKFMMPPGDKLFSCGAGLGRGCVDAYGRFQLCMTLRSPATTFDLGNGSLRDALTEFFPRVRQIQATNPDYPGKSYLEHGTLDTPVEYLCEIAHAEARYLRLLAEEEMAWEVRDWRERLQTFSNERVYASGARRDRRI
jgi:MoaA/NifB/PqqE/SkfB family radical SAM enzyme